jgi:quaternary ammonium compound-resistance protein SugE
MAWLSLLIAGLLEVAWAIGLKHTEGFSRHPGLGVLTAIGMILSFVFLGYALRTIPLGTGYAVWTGIGAVGTAILGIALLGEDASPVRLLSLGLIVLGLVGLKMSSAH